MNTNMIPATFMRGGSSKGLFFNASDLPSSQNDRDQIFLNSMGSPDTYGRQLDGMGGGLSSLSKAVIIEPSKRKGADIDYTFAQVSVDLPIVDYSATCGNLSAAVGPFAIDAGMVKSTESMTLVRVFNTNLKHFFHANIPTRGGKFKPDGDYEICGVSGAGSKICLDYIAPGGSTTGNLLPTGKTYEILEIPGEGQFVVSIVDAGTLTIFLDSKSFDLTNTESISVLESNTNLMETLEKIRRVVGVHLGISTSEQDCPLGTPKICLVSKPENFKSISGLKINKADSDISARYLSMGKVHRVLPATGAMCLGVASLIEGTICNNMLLMEKKDIRISNPSGVLTISPEVTQEPEGWSVKNIRVYRTARTLMVGHVVLP